MIEVITVTVKRGRPPLPPRDSWLECIRESVEDIEYQPMLIQELVALVHVRYDHSWERQFKNLQSLGIIDSYGGAMIDCKYSDHDYQSASVFTYTYTGRHVNIPSGRDHRYAVCNITSMDDSGACKQCGNGVMQSGPVCLPSTELNRCRDVFAISFVSNKFLFMTKRFVQNMQTDLGLRIPSLDIQARGRTSPRESWLQIIPEESLDARWFRAPRHECVTCAECRAVRLRVLPAELPAIDYYCINRGRNHGLRLPPVAWSPYVYGKIEKFDDGRLVATPSRHIWLRNDVANYIALNTKSRVSMRPVIDCA